MIRPFSGGTVSVVDIDAVGFVADNRDVCTQLGVNFFSYFICRPVGAVQHQLATLDIHIQRAL